MISQEIDVPHDLQRTLDLLRSAGIDEAVNALGPKSRTTAVDLAEQIVLLGRLVRPHDPGLALQLAERALAEDVRCVEAWLLNGVVRDSLGSGEAASAALMQVLDSPGATPRQVLLAATMIDSPSHQEKGLAAGCRAFAELGRPLRWAAPLLGIAQRCADWRLARELQCQLAEAYARDAFDETREIPRTHANWCGDESINLRHLAAWSLRTLNVQPPVLSPLSHPKLLGDRRLRVGYLSSDFREHPSGWLLNGLFHAHDKSVVELFMYCSGWDDRSALRRELEAHFEHVHHVARLSDATASALIRSHGIDVLVDLNGPTRAHRMGILAHRPAPVQIDYLGWPGSVGGRVVDYIVADDYVVPPDRQVAYPERLIRLFPTYWVSGYGEREKSPAREAYGLPPVGPVLGMFNVITKVSAEVWTTWMRILAEVPEATLWLLDPGPTARRHIARFTAQFGIDPQRILAAPRMSHARHLVRLQCCDLMLDPWPYGGHTTTSDALFAGVPVVALEGTNYAGRVSGSLLRAAGLEAMVQPNHSAYVQTAVRLLRNPERLARLREFIAREVPRSPLFDTAARARQLEQAYKVAYERAVSGLAPVNLNFMPATP